MGKVFNKKKDVPTNDSSPVPPESSATQLFDLDVDSIMEICEYLDIQSQCALFKSSKLVAAKILQGKWYYDYHKDGFDMEILEKLTVSRQAECLAVVMQCIPKIKNIPLQVFRRYINATEIVTLPHIKFISIHYSRHTFIDKSIVDFKEFRRFPCLQELELRNLYIDFNDKELVLPLNRLYLNCIIVMHDEEGDFLNKIFCKDLKKLTILSVYSGFTLTTLTEISKCSQLKDVTLSKHYLYYADNLTAFLKLPQLENINLEFYDNFSYSSDDNLVFAAILANYSKEPKCKVKEVMTYGIPRYACLIFNYLNQVCELNSVPVNQRTIDKFAGRVYWAGDVDKCKTAVNIYLDKSAD